MKVPKEFSVMDHEWDAAEDEIERRLEAGEQLDVLVCCLFQRDLVSKQFA